MKKKGNYMKKKGFTLAEVLMTLSIIGVVAAITLPTLNHNLSKQALEKQTLKFYSVLKDVVEKGIAENGSIYLTKKFITSNFDVIDYCYSGHNCLEGVTYRSVDGKLDDRHIPKDLIYQDMIYGELLFILTEEWMIQI